jgi:FkbM family methyltransferase
VASRSTIYDVGANNGDDLPYYLLRADKVVAIEANPLLCDQIRARFQEEISAGRLIVENCVLSDQPGDDEVDFYIHRGFHIWSQFPRPEPERLGEFDCRRLRSRFIVDVLRQHGEPLYVKIDVERFDGPLLSAMFKAGVRPPYVSAECTSFEIPAILSLEGGYRAFKLVDAQSVHRTYRRRIIKGPGASTGVEFSFPMHAAGPFGDDIDGPWMSADHVVELIGICGFGWRDLHATNLAEPEIDVAKHHRRVAAAILQRGTRTAQTRLRRVLPKRT